MDKEQFDKIKERIAKLLSMARDASSPNEAAIAAQRARALMDKHQIDEYDISEAKPDAFASEFVSRAFAAVPYHINVLSVAVAKYNDCQSLFNWDLMNYKMESKQNQNNKVGGGRTKKWGKRLVFCGYKSDVELAKQMLERLLENIDALCKEYMRVNHPGKYNVRLGSEYKTAAVRALVMTFNEMTIERQALTYSNGTSLVVAKAHQVEEKFGVIEYQKTTKSSSVDDLDGDRAKEAGWRDGQSIEIIKRIDD